MNDERHVAAYADNRYVAQFPGGRVTLKLHNVPLHALTAEDRAFLDDLIKSVNALGAPRTPPGGTE